MRHPLIDALDLRPPQEIVTPEWEIDWDWPVAPAVSRWRPATNLWFRGCDVVWDPAFNALAVFSMKSWHIVGGYPRVSRWRRLLAYFGLAPTIFLDDSWR